MITIETKTIENKTHEDGFEYNVIRTEISNGPSDTFAHIPNCRTGAMRKEDNPLYKAKVKGKYYRFDGTSIVCVGSDPTFAEISECITKLADDLIAKNAHLFLIETECNDCDKIIESTYLFIESHGVLNVGCGDAFRIFQQFVEVNMSGKISGVTEEFDENTLTEVVENYLSLMQEIEEWLNA